MSVSVLVLDIPCVYSSHTLSINFLFIFICHLDMMKKMQEKKTEWKAAGHGEYSEIPEEKEFFNVTKSSDNCVIHFYRDETFRCKILDKHFHVLAKKHLETRFCKINAEKCPFLCDRLKIRMIPTVLMIKNQQTRGQILGFTELGNTDEFSTEMLEWRLAHVSVIITLLLFIFVHLCSLFPNFIFICIMYYRLRF